MSWMESFTFVMRANINALREKIEDPERMLHQLICDMEEELESVRHSVASAIADEIQLGKDLETLRREIGEWEGRAEAALKKENEKIARQALEQKLRLEERLATIETVFESQSEQTVKLQSSFRGLEEKIRQAKHKRTLLLARLAQAESKKKIHQTIESSEGKSAFAQFARLETRVEHAENMCEAYDRLDGVDPDVETLKAELDVEEHKERLEREFEELKIRMEAQTS